MKMGCSMTSKFLYIGVLIALLNISQLVEAGNHSLFGGVSGGGGNVINPTPPIIPATKETVETLITQSYMNLESYLRNIEKTYLEHKMNLTESLIFAKIFDGSNNVFTKISIFKPKIEERHSCYDFELKPVDASISFLNENNFCISSFSIREKVIESDIRDQAMALMIHEYSELSGATEEEAIFIQRNILDDLKTVNNF